MDILHGILPRGGSKSLGRPGSLNGPAIILAAAVLFYPTFYKLSAFGWPSAHYGHGYYVLPISLGIIWTKRRSLSLCRGISAGGLMLFAGALALYGFGALEGFMVLEAAGVVGVIWAIFFLRYGAGGLKEILFPLGYLVMLIPPPGILLDSLTFPLRRFSVEAGRFLLEAWHFPVTSYGAILNVGGQELFVTEACSGFRSLTALFCVGAVYLYFQNIPLFKKGLLFLTIVPLALLGNALRIAFCGFLAYVYGMEAVEGFFHSVSGVLLFLFMLTGLMGLTAWVSGGGRQERLDESSA